MQTTFIILKPDCIKANRIGTIIDRFERQDLKVVACKMTRLTPEILRMHYAHVVERPFYPELEAFMLSEPVVFLALRGENAIARVREMLGPTDSAKAPKGTIRGDFGTDTTVNFVHASDSEQSANTELARFFKPEEIYFN